MKYTLIFLLSLFFMQVQAQTSQPAAQPTFFSFARFDFWVLLLYLLLAALAAYMLIAVRARFSLYRSEIGMLKTRISALSAASQQPSVGDTKKQVEMLVANHPQWEHAQEEIKALLLRLEALEASRQPVAAQTDLPIRKEKRPALEIFYMTFPVGNYFPITAKSDSRDNTIYRFKVRPGKTEADFEVHTGGATMQELIGLVQTYIKPACDEENMPSPQVTGIITRQPGLAVLEDDKWIIKKKALIRYE